MPIVHAQTDRPRRDATQLSRRALLSRTGSGLGSIALAHLLASEGVLAPARAAAAAKQAHHPPRAKAIIWLFMEGGPSHIDLFDPKPELEKLAGQITPSSFNLPVTSATGSHRMPLVASQRKWKQHGQGGLWVSDWYPHVAEHADDLAVIRSCWSDGVNHVGANRQMNTGSILAGRPSLGAWTTYGLGSSSRDLPAFVVLTDNKVVRGGPTNWSSGFLPATYQGTHLRKDGPPILHLQPPSNVTDSQQRSRLELLRELNGIHADKWPAEEELEARIESYELAYRMQASAPKAVDLNKESEATKRLYGMDEDATRQFGTNCLLARRLVEHGVRFVEVYCGSGSGWDAHSGLEANHEKWCKVSDKPIAALLKDLKARGLLHETLVVWGGEFGRTPFTDTNSLVSAPEEYGRDHNPWGFTIWMAGGGIRGGRAIGATDAIGFRAVDKPYHVHDIHATMLHMLGLNHLSLTYLHNGRAERPTINGGVLMEEVLS
ncbi:MAG: DUF1501 domain-containing protein [Acidobacteriia bacterium]|nr:DUF1501 domain-containing protein [Terriglobia bacterium]MYC67582.1 DUF1501 domain-containing protein [Terriglobia bacterium]